MPPQQQLQWKGPPVPRAKPVPPEKWEEHREELCGLYQRMALDDLMAMVKVRHGFAPSRRQYISQFEKWGVHKYKVTSKDYIQPERQALPSQHSSGTGADQESGDNDLSQTPITQICPTKRQQSLREKPEVPPKKRQKLSDFMSSKDPYAGLGLAFDASQPSSQNLAPSGRVASHPGGTPPNTVYGRADVVVHIPGSRGDDNGRATSSDISSADMLPPCSEGLNSSELDDFEISTSQRHSVGQIFPRERRLDSSRPIDTFSPDEIQDMKRAADFLFSLFFRKEAFALYVLILKRLKDSSNQPAWVASSAMILCARSAVTLPQVEIARSLLEQELHKPQGLATGVENFLFRMLLAHTYTRHCDYSTASFHREIAMGSGLTDEGLLANLPQETRSLDIITYHCLTSGLGCDDDLVEEKTLRYPPQGSLVLDKNQIQERLLQREPGPFELKHGSMKNLCIRSCLRWCTGELECTATIPSMWENLQSDDQNPRAAEIIRVYCFLWKRWQSCRTEYADPELVLWIRQAEKLMGISPAELLVALCQVIMDASPPRNDKPEWDLVCRARIGAKSLSLRPDEKLGHQFLDAFSFMNTLTFLPPKMIAFINTARTHTRNFIEKSLAVILPDVQDSETDELSDTPRRSVSIVAATLFPTLAPSLHSSDFASLRALRDRIQHHTRSAMQDVAITLPSSVFRASSRSNLSLPSMSELTQAMASSLSLSSLQQAGTSALDTLATVSSNVRDRVAEFEESPFGEAIQRLT
ncbi:MAG: hypothetical protein M1839_007296 [Geoglossum umbratile]|nr:MAG: hypothetical protein M1839_007296 [Geoglossum umbratile]